MEYLVLILRAEKGMTLIEVLVAMAIVAVALVALIRIQSQAVDVRPRLEQQYMAALLAENILIEYELEPPNITDETLSGTRSMGVFEFSWRADFSETSQLSLIRVDLDIFLDNSSVEKGLADKSRPSFRLMGFIRHDR